MKYQLWITSDRVKFLQKELKNKVEIVGEDENGSTPIEVTINDNFDLLSVFHAGLYCGMTVFRPILELA